MKFLNFKFILTDLGFNDIQDYITSIIGFKNNILAPISFITAGTISMFIEHHIWSRPHEIYFLAILVFIDLLTGFWKSYVHRRDSRSKFRSRRIGRTAGKLITYSLVLFIAFNLDKNMPVPFFWMPYSCLAVFYASEAWSIFENLGKIGFLNDELIQFIKKKLDIKNILNSFDKGNPSKNE